MCSTRTTDSTPPRISRPNCPLGGWDTREYDADQLAHLSASVYDRGAPASTYRRGSTWGAMSAMVLTELEFACVALPQAYV